MKITVICVGKVKEKFYREAITEFSKRLSGYCRLEIIEVADEKTPDSAGEALEEQIKKKEASRILKYIKEDAFLFTLEIQGKQYESVTKRADEAISFSRMTFPHQLMRVILLEQIYRSFRILSGEPYHK